MSDTQRQPGPMLDYRHCPLILKRHLPWIIAGTVWQVLGPQALRLLPDSEYVAGAYIISSLIILALMIAAAHTAGNRIRRALKRRGMSCGSCGYDLRGLHEGNACPECGAFRPSDSLLRFAWANQAAILVLWKYRRWTPEGRGWLRRKRRWKFNSNPR